VRRRTVERHAELLAFLAGHVAPGQHAGALLDVLRPDLDAHRHAAKLPLAKRKPGCLSNIVSIFTAIG
jgi:hypothetical protein